MDDRTTSLVAPSIGFSIMARRIGQIIKLLGGFTWHLN